jgi:hypothetical protein
MEGREKPQTDKYKEITDDWNFPGGWNVIVFKPSLTHAV